MSGERDSRRVTNGEVPAEHTGTPGLGQVRFGDLRRVEPISRNFGFDRGLPIDRVYIERFLSDHAADIHGHVLEFGDDVYTRAFGGQRVSRRDVLHISRAASPTTIVADISDAPHIPTASFDCIICTQTLQLVYNLGGAVRTLHRILKPDGVLLATFPGISQIDDATWAGSWYWSLTPLSAQRLFGEMFGEHQIEVTSRGNVLTATSFLQGLAAEELTKAELAVDDPAFPFLLTVRASKGRGHAASRDGGNTT